MTSYCTELDSASSNQVRRIAVTSHARLHFGLLEIHPNEPHCYGGLGLMLNEPVASVVATVRPSVTEVSRDRSTEALAGGDTTDNPIEPFSVHADTYWTERALQCIAHWKRITGRRYASASSIRVELPPTPHCGLGSGTQMACSIATLLAAASQVNTQQCNASNGLLENSARLASSVWTSDGTATLETLGPAVRDLSAHSGRGKRSFVGLTGFLTGGMIVDRGQSIEGASWASRTQVVPFPESWPVLLIRADKYVGESGGVEAAMFERCASKANPHRHAMLDLVDAQIIRSLHSLDWKMFSNALRLYGEMAGEIFRDVQGGIYRSEEIAQIIKEIQSLGLEGTGQSSWGPTVFAIAQDSDQANWIAHKLRQKLGGPETVTITRAANHGAQLVNSNG